MLSQVLCVQCNLLYGCILYAGKEKRKAKSVFFKFFLILKQILLNQCKEKYTEQWKVLGAVDDVQEALSWFDLKLASVSH